MFSLFATRSMVVALLMLPQVARAQSESAYVGFFGLAATPVGAFTPIISGRSASTQSGAAFQVRAANWSFDRSDESVTNIGVGAVIPRGRTRTTLEVGYGTTSNCDQCGVFMAGADVQFELTSPSASTTGASVLVALNPALGLGVPQEGSGSAITAGMSLPVSASFNAGTSLRLVPFISPGFGFSRVSGEGDAQTGSRAMLAGGVSIGGQKSPVVVTASARRIFLDDAPTMYGIGLMIGR